MKKYMKLKIVMVIIFIFAILSSFIYYFDEIILPSVLAICDGEMRERAVQVMNKSILEKYVNEFDYEDETLKINFEKMQIYKSKELIVLTANEFKVLKVFVENKGKILSRDKIIEELFMDLYDGYDRNVDTYIKNIRAKIEKNSREPEYIMTVYGAGYKFSEKN